MAHEEPNTAQQAWGWGILVHLPTSQESEQDRKWPGLMDPKNLCLETFFQIYPTS